MKLAVFDIDGTLTNTNSVDSECFVAALANAHAIGGINTNWDEYPHTTDSGITEHIFQERLKRSPSEGELIKFQERFVQLLEEQQSARPEEFAAIPGAAVALELLEREAQWAVALATGCWRASALMKLRAAKIEFEGIPAAFAEDGVSREEIVETAIAKASEHYGQQSFEKIVSIGDGRWDVRAARRLGLAFLGIGSGTSADGLRNAGARHVIADFTAPGRLIAYLNDASIPVAESL